jgi:hypothetical protein
MESQCGKREAQITGKMQELDIAISNLSDTTSRVIDRLKSISRSEKEVCNMETTKCPTPVIELVPLGGQINDIINRVLAIQRQNDSLLSRLEI